MIIDPLTLAEFPERKGWLKKGHDYCDEVEFVYDCLRLDIDGYYFIDYLKAAQKEIESPEEYILYVERHKVVVEEFIGIAKKPALKRKAIWLGNYHNMIVRELRGTPKTDSNRLEISSNLLKA